MSQSSSSPPVVIPEVLLPENPEAARGPSPPPPRPARVIIEPLAALALIVVDNLWTLPDFLVVDWFITVPLCFLTASIVTFLVQRRRAGDRRRIALAKALVLGVAAAIPFPVTGTAMGLALLAWFGIRHPWRT